LIRTNLSEINYSNSDVWLWYLDTSKKLLHSFHQYHLDLMRTPLVLEVLK